VVDQAKMQVTKRGQQGRKPMPCAATGRVNKHSPMSRTRRVWLLRHMQGQSQLLQDSITIEESWVSPQASITEAGIPTTPPLPKRPTAGPLFNSHPPSAKLCTKHINATNQAQPLHACSGRAKTPEDVRKTTNTDGLQHKHVCHATPLFDTCMPLL
jgi:hypothetical protein